MPIIFSDHAKLQLKRRKISQKVVIRTIKSSDEVLLSFRLRKLRRMQVGDKILEVVTRTEGSELQLLLLTIWRNNYENEL